MAEPLPAAPAPLEAPFANPANVDAELPLAGVNAEGYLAGGTVSGSLLSYPDVASFLWFDALELPDRIRSSYEVTLGRTLVGTPQADVSAGETVPRAESVRIGDLVAYPTMIRPTRPIAVLRAIEDAGGLPTFEQPIAYETRLAALSRLFPPSLYTTTQDALGQATATAQEVLQHLFDVWADLFPDFRAKPVPPLVLFVPDETGRYTRTLETDRIYLKQPEGQERSIQTLLEDFRAVFVGYGVTVDAEGELVIVPPPWAAGISRDREAPLAYRVGPGFAPDLATIGAVGREDVGAAPIAVDADFAGDELELEAEVHLRLSSSPTGPASSTFELFYSGVRSAFAAVLTPNATVRVERELTSSLFAGGPDVYARAVYDVTWTRPGATGGTISVAVVEATTSFANPSVLTGGSAPTLYVGHALTLGAYALGELGLRARTVTADEIEGPVPAPSFDGSRVINRQAATYRDLDFVEDTPLLPSLSTRIGATTYTPAGTANVAPATFQPFLGDDDEPLIAGEEIEISFDYQLRRAVNAEGASEEDRDGYTRSETFTLRPGQTRSFTYTLNGEVPLTFGTLVTVRFRYVIRDGVAGVLADFPFWTTRSTNVLLTRPWFGHVLAFDVTGSVYQETGEDLEVVYDETSGDPDVLSSQALYGVREGPPIEVNFFRVTYEDLLAITSAIVRYNQTPRARYAGVKLTPASEITPDDLGLSLLLPWGVAAVLEAYRYDDARSIESSRATRELDLVLLYPLIDSAGAFASDVESAVEETSGISGASIVLDAD